MKFYHIQTFGCQMNEYDSERIAAVLEARGLLPSEPEDADMVILNTCSVREKPQHKVDSSIGRLRQLQTRNGKPSVIGIMGCVAQQEGDEFLKRFSCVSFVLGTDNLHLLDTVLDEVAQGRRVSNTQWRESGFSIEPFTRRPSLSAFVTIMKGCDNYCSYCIVPYVRGREISRTPSEVLEEINILADEGVKEITLLGQNVNSYGKEFTNMSFSKLLEKTAKVEGLARVRFVTSHPKDFSMDIVQIMADHPNICPFIHLPLQSGSNEVLKRMNRHYTWEMYYDNILKAKEILPSLRFSSDFIVGFPGETVFDFEQTLNALQLVEYESIFAFNYSIRPGTSACRFEDDISTEEKSRRLALLLNLQKEITDKRYANAEGTLVNVLVEGPSKKDPSVYTGRTVYGRAVNFTGSADLMPGEETDVIITEIKPNSLYGKQNLKI